MGQQNYSNDDISTLLHHHVMMMFGHCVFAGQSETKGQLNPYDDM